MEAQTPVIPALGADIRIVFPEAGLTAIFDECDQFDRDETGGRLEHSPSTAARAYIASDRIIESGPQAKRSPVSFFKTAPTRKAFFVGLKTDTPRSNTSAIGIPTTSMDCLRSAAET